MPRKKKKKGTKVKCILCHGLFIPDGIAAKKHALKPEDACVYYEKKDRGRPTKFSVKMITEVYNYLDACEDEREQLIKSEGVASTSYENLLKVNIPTIERLCLRLKITKETLYQWKKKNQEFSDAIDELKLEQADRLTSGGLSGQYNSRYAIFMSNVNHGMVERKEISGPDGESLFGSLIDQIDDDEEDNE